ncbi:hypothetical protein BGZ47_002077 [Haplosporangium gracile]|nr:hypothetical protein BGZ47_002077 [Haplosporangium gracile]
MSRKGAVNSKFGHLFGDSDNSSISSRENRLSGSGDLYKDPLAAFIPPITATTATTRGGSSTAKATLSPPPSATAATAATATASRGVSPPTSGSNSRSSSRLQNHSLFSSLTGGGGGSDSGNVSGGSLFDSTPTPTLSAAKRDLLFGDSGGGSTNSNSSVSRRTSTPPLSRNSNNTTTTQQQSSSRVPTPPMGGNSTRAGNNTSFLDADASPLGGPLGDFSAKAKENDDVLSPLSTAPLTRTNSQASTKSHESVRSSRSARSQDVSVVDSSTTLRSGITTKPAASGAGAGAGAAGSNIKEAASLPLIPSSTSSSTTSSLARRVITRTSIDQRQTITATAAETSPMISDPIFNPLTTTHSQLPPPPRHSSDWDTPQSIPSTTSSQSIETFQSISRTSSPTPPAAPAASRPLLLSKNGFERDHLDNIVSASSSPSPLSKCVPMMIPADDDAAAAFASDSLYSTGPALSTPSSSSILDSGFSHSRASISYLSSSSGTTSASKTTGASTVAGAAAIAAAASVLRPGIGAGTVGQPKTRSGFSLGEDVADSSNPWMNTLVDSLEETKLTREPAPKIVDYTQSEAASAFTATTALPRSLGSSSSSSVRRTVVTPLPPSLEDDVGGFQDMFAGLRSSSSFNRGSGTATPTPSLFPPSTTSSTSASSQLNNGTTRTTLSVSSWNVLDAVEAAAQDPDFLGPSAIVNQSAAKVLALMQMPKDALDKDISAQEVFDNPWE